MYFDKYVASVDYIEAGNVIAVMHDDSSISFFDAQSLNAPNTQEEEDVTSMVQAGFTFPIDTPGKSRQMLYDSVLYRVINITQVSTYRFRRTIALP